MKKTIIALSLGLGISTLGANGAFAYTVKQGDTLGAIAKSNGTDLNTVVGLNPQINDPNRIFPNQNIKLPSETTSPVTETAPKGTTGKVNVTSSDKLLMERLVQAEAGGEPYAGKVAVATVVLNRVLDESFPNEVRSVIYQEGQFSPVANGTINNTPSADSRKAVEEAIEFVNSGNSSGSLFFYNPKTATSRWLDSHPTVTTIGNHVFKR